MAALINRILRQVSASPMTSAQIVGAWPSYRTKHITESIARLLRLDLVEADVVGRLSCTHAGRVAAAMTKPPRWSAPRTQRHSPPILAKIAR